MITLCLLAAFILIALDHGVLQRKVRPLLLADTAAASDHRLYHTKSFVVVRVIDGDTLDIDAPDNDAPYTRVRLLGIDTPETKGVAEPMYFGPEASAFATDLAEGKQVTLYLPRDRTRDRYGRLLAYVKLPDGDFLNEILLNEGLAYADTRFDHDLFNKYKQLESMARARGKGLWKNITPEKMPQWRQN